MTDDLLARLRALDVCAVSDALDALGLPPSVGVLGRLSGDGLVSGRAVTVEVVEGPAPPDAPKVHLGARAIDAAGPDSVIVVAHPGIDAGGWGGVLSNGARAKGVAGVIVDGPIRDIDEARALDFPTFGRGTTSRTARGRVHEARSGQPVTIAGTRVAPGDYVIGDGSGVAFVPAEMAEAVVAKAERIAARERLMTADLLAGRPAVAVLGADYESMLEAGDE